jgi:D-3-phosphoglycerate dehydrogenase
MIRDTTTGSDRAPRIAITTSSFARHDEAPLRLLRDAGLEIVLNPHGRTLTANEAGQTLAGCAGVVAGTEPLNREVLAALPELRVISRVGVGLDNIDLDYAAERGILVRSTPDGPTRAVAELTLAVALDLLRQVSRMDRALRRGEWNKRMGRLLLGRRVGVIGLGRIGRAVAGLFAGLGAEAAFADPVAVEAPWPRLALPELLARSEIVSLHCGKQTKPLLGPAELDLLPAGAYVLNLARGGLVDEAALAERLADGRLAGAALDVYAREPYAGPLCGLENAVLTPHAASYALEGRVKMETDAARNLVEALGQAGTL